MHLTDNRLDPTSMENKKGIHPSTPSVTSPNEIVQNEALSTKHSHQHNAPLQHLRLLQYGLKMSNHQHPLVNQSHPHQQINSPLHLHMHAQVQYQHQQNFHRHLSPASQLNSTNYSHNYIHQHQDKNTQPIDQKQTSIHLHTQILQNSPQIWVPHQPPVHYHQQNKTEEKNVIQPSKTKENLERKKSNNSQVRSPSAKRPINAPVTMQGWLYKQGSEGLMLWKKRWFVLSEYCLFYYKSPEEEKLLGSILLPSYKVSICGPEDKVNKKFAFKCEHANMRTYILAADSQELMMQWIRVLNLACLLQTTVESEQVNYTSVPNNSNYHHQQHYHQSQVENTPIHVHSSSNTTDLSNQSQQELSQYNHQPLYANAPPKPRRLNDGSYTSSSPDVLERYNPDVPIMRNTLKSPVNLYGHVHIKPHSPQPEYVHHRPQHDMHYMYTPTRDVPNIPQNVERRTPDTYGRSKLTPVKTRHPTDYEDIYTDQAMYKRPLSPIAYSHVKKNPIVNTPYRAYTPPHMLDSKEVLCPIVQMRKSPIPVVRPHSADFLEYELNHRRPNYNVLTRQQPRPKSSLDINKYSNSDNYFYSEERYAEKMRKSAQYLSNMPKCYTTPHERKLTTNKFPENESNFVLMRSNTQPIDFNNVDINDIQQPVRSRSVLSEGSLSRELDIDLRNNQQRIREALSPTFTGRQDYVYHYDDNSKNKENEQFIRSASARLTTQNELQDHNHMTVVGDRKREESMKRLLEWKQRMLQSPLNRKVQNHRVYSGRPQYYSKKSDDPEYHVSQNDQNVYSNGRSVNNLPQYNSYSSDDEENEEGSKENVQSQAGRTLDTFSNNSESFTPAHTASITVFNTLKEPDKPLSQSDTLHDHTHINKSLEDVKENDIACEESTFTKPLIEFNKESSNLAHVSSLRSEFSDKFEPTPTITEIKSNGALVKSILAEFERKSNDKINKSPIKDLEENYMTMTSKKNILQSRFSTSSDATLILNELEENPYVEMTQNIDMSFLESTIEHEPYEMVCFNDNKFEPVYMELKNPEKNKEIKELPDVITQKAQRFKMQCNNKSDSSDADDEASKDLDSLDTPSNPRFSLSDNFRPASYYLGASQNVTEFPDSSDSELVSPPPIPTSPPLLEDLDNTDESLITNRNSDQFFNSRIKIQTKTQKLKDQDSSSVCSITVSDTDQNRRLRSRLSQNSDSDVELRIPISRSSEYEKMLKRRPVAEELCDELDSVTSDFNNTVDFDKYLSDLQISNLNDTDDIQIKKFHEYENFCINRTKSENLQQRTDITECNKLDLQKRAESSASTSVEICGFLQDSNRSTPSIRISSSLSVQEIPTVSSYFSDRRNLSSNSSLSQPAPYYYSDLCMNISDSESNSTILTLNNQRRALNGNKRDITRIMNPIKCNSQLRSNIRSSHGNIVDNNTFKLAAEARSASVDFLNLTDKSGHIDKKNIYESDTLKRLKMSESVGANPETRNLYPPFKIDKFNNVETVENNVRRSQSLEGLLENVFTEHLDTQNHNLSCEVTNNEGSYLWEEDSIWRERLRSASQRHTKSMDDLDCIGDNKKIQKKSPRGITRVVTYVNDNVYNMPLQNKSQEIQTKSERKEGSFVIDREKLRQWDLMSSGAPSNDQLSTITASQGPVGNNTVLEIGEGMTCEPVENFNTQQPAASGSVSINTRDRFAKAAYSKRVWPQNPVVQSRSVTNLTRNPEDNYIAQQEYYLSQTSNPRDLHAHNDKWSLNDKMNVSAGELLDRTHEELVLLLIQLRRQNSNTLQAIENCYNEIDTIQAQLHGSILNQEKRLENLQKLEQIKQHLIELEKQYEKGKPLVNLVDNMVKLGSLYRTPNERSFLAPEIKDRLEFNQQIQERRLLAEERRDWNRLNFNHTQLQEKVQQLYKLDKLIQEESGTLQNLQQDKEEIEKALGGLKHRLNKGFSDPAEIEEARKQQVNLENELSRVHLMLAQNSKKLEETVAGNARLEQELLILKQKLQISRQQRSSPQFSNAGDSMLCAAGTSAMLESDLQRVQQKVGDLQKQRQELSLQVKQLTNRSNTLQQQVKHSPTTQNNQNVTNKKKVNSFWRETDLDTMNVIDHGDSWDNQFSDSVSLLYINTDSKPEDLYNRGFKTDSSDDTLQNLISYEKPEIKTVRIVKRESERRQRDREKSATGKWDALLEEDNSSQNSSILFRPTPVQKTQSSTNVISPTFETDKTSGILSRQSSLSSPSLPQTFSDRISSIADGNTDRSPELSPIFKSEAARQIITEMSQDTSKYIKRRAIPKEKRRHYTAPHNNLIMKSLNHLPTNDNSFDKIVGNDRRARDDLDMERALRQRIDTPDVVRSTLSSKELKYNESTIDNILGTPNKISIPERYIPEQLPQLSAEEQEHRLRKVESIKKMLSDAAIISSSSTSSTNPPSDEKNKTATNITTKATSKMIEEKKQREHLLQLNQILAKQVMEMSKIVAGTNANDEQ